MSLARLARLASPRGKGAVIVVVRPPTTKVYRDGMGDPGPAQPGHRMRAGHPTWPGARPGLLPGRQRPGSIRGAKDAAGGRIKRRAGLLPAPPKSTPLRTHCCPTPKSLRRVCQAPTATVVPVCVCLVGAL